MTRSLAAHNIYVEGDDDLQVLSHWFPHLQFTVVGGKDQVRSHVSRDENRARASHGLLDRDFAPDDEIADSRKAGSRLVIMRRYCIENYLLEPDIIASAVKSLPDASNRLLDWLDEDHTRRRLCEWADELALYAAANSIIAEWRERIMFDQQLGFLRYFGPLPPVARTEVLASLQRRLASLTPIDQIEGILDARFALVRVDVKDWDGLQRWINGKVLLDSYLFPNVFELAGLSKIRSRDLLIESGRTQIPTELGEIAKVFESSQNLENEP
jgi:hypothetical protein